MKKLIGCLIIVLSVFLLTGCETGKNKNNSFQKMSFDELKGIKKVKEDSGKLDTGEKWQSVRYVTDDMVLSIFCYEDRDMSKGISLRQDLKDKKINNINYKYSQMKVKEDRLFDQYYTQVGKDTYHISVTYEKNDQTKEKLDNFLKSITIKK